MVIGHFDSHRYRELVLEAVDAEYPVHLNGRSAGGFYGTLDPVWPEGDFGIARTFEDLPMHAPVAAVVSTVAARSIHHNLTVDRAA